MWLINPRLPSERRALLISDAGICKDSNNWEMVIDWLSVAKAWITAVSDGDNRFHRSCQSGQAVLRLAAYPYPDYGVLLGAVVAIAPDTTTPVNSPVAYYEVTIQPEKAFLTKDQRQFPLQAAMDVTAEIVSKQETVLTFVMRKVRLLTDH